MSTVTIRKPAKSAEIIATIIRADGTIEHLGRISYWHKNPLRRLAWRVQRFLKGLSL